MLKIRILTVLVTYKLYTFRTVIPVIHRKTFCLPVSYPEVKIRKYSSLLTPSQVQANFSHSHQTTCNYSFVCFNLCVFRQETVPLYSCLVAFAVEIAILILGFSVSLTVICLWTCVRVLKAFTTFNKTSDFSDFLHSVICYLRFEVSASEYIRNVFKHVTFIHVFCRG